MEGVYLDLDAYPVEWSVAIEGVPITVDLKASSITESSILKWQIRTSNILSTSDQVRQLFA